MVFDAANNRYVARDDAPDLELLAEASGWRLRDGAGQEFHFTQSVNTNFWLLKSITNTRYNNRVDISYLVYTPSFTGGQGTAIDLVSVKYNTHPNDPTCTKDEIKIIYGSTISEPLSVSPSILLINSLPLVHMRMINAVEVLQRPACSGTGQRVRRYEFDYTNDLDTTLPQLRSVRMAGRLIPSVADDYMPVATYGYGAATTGGATRKLRYREAAATMPFPADNPAQTIARTFFTTAAISGGGEHHTSMDNLLDVNGDGRPDLVFNKNNDDRLWVAHYVRSNGLTTTPF